MPHPPLAAYVPTVRCGPPGLLLAQVGQFLIAQPGMVKLDPCTAGFARRVDDRQELGRVALVVVVVATWVIRKFA